MARSRFRSDAGLTIRMTVVMLLLGVLYLAVMAGLIVAGVGTVAVLVIAALFGVGQWYFSDKLAMAAMRARIVTPEQAPELHGMIDRLCALADMPKPRVAIAESHMPNAFATGRSPEHSVVCVTTDILRRLDREELEGVLSHELSHVAHRDVAVMTIAGFLGVVAGLVMRWGLFFGGGRRDNNGVPVWLFIWLGSIVVYGISFLLTRVLSRYRELCADRSGAYLTGKPSALASALTKVTGTIAQIPTKDLREDQPFNAFMFAPALNGKSITGLFATHPSLDKRLEQLARISADLSRPTA
ncbi:MAG: heat shock protein HtpX [Nocardioidaceae bacterium]|jgi:heat shock protein HtpX|nr:heat shock protein HtpX [Nocardioidaceae bacterium]